MGLHRIRHFLINGLEDFFRWLERILDLAPKKEEGAYFERYLIYVCKNMALLHYLLNVMKVFFSNPKPEDRNMTTQKNSIRLTRSATHYMTYPATPEDSNLTRESWP